jgi:hypothetical protein
MSNKYERFVRHINVSTTRDGEARASKWEDLHEILPQLPRLGEDWEGIDDPLDSFSLEMMEVA